MGILDDAIREHLDLKRKHGARDAELREIEDEAFGSTDRPDAFTGGELFTEVTASGVIEAGSAVAEPPESDVGDEEPTRLVEPEALPPAAEPVPESEFAAELESVEGLELDEDPLSSPEGSPIPGQEELVEPIPGQEELLDEAEPPAPSESLEDLIAEEEPFPEDTAAPPPPPDTAERPGLEGEVEPPEPAPGPPDPEPEEIVAPEPESSVPDPPPPPPEAGSEPPGRARGRVDVPTQEHPPPGDTGDLPPFEPEDRPQPLSASDPEPLGAPEDDTGDGPALYDFETDEEPVEPGPAGDTDDDFDALGPAEEEAPFLDDEEPYAEEPLPPLDEPGTAVRPAVDDDDLEDEPPPRGKVYEEDDSEEDLWFEKGPPKDFDFDD